jgi:hypothetical protein
MNYVNFECCRLLWLAPHGPYVYRRSSETSIHIRTTRHYIREDGNIHNYRYENFTCYVKISNCKETLTNYMELSTTREVTRCYATR